MKIATHALQLLLSKVFRLTKWNLNSEIILDQLLSYELEIKNEMKDVIYGNRFPNLLGLSETLNQALQGYPKISKEIVMEREAYLFGPLEFVAPCLIEPKPITRELWYKNTKWDQTLSDDR